MRIGSRRDTVVLSEKKQSPGGKRDHHEWNEDHCLHGWMPPGPVFGGSLQGGSQILKMALSRSHAGSGSPREDGRELRTAAILGISMGFFQEAVESNPALEVPNC